MRLGILAVLVIIRIFRDARSYARSLQAGSAVSAKKRDSREPPDCGRLCCRIPAELVCSFKKLWQDYTVERDAAPHRVSSFSSGCCQFTPARELTARHLFLPLQGFFQNYTTRERKGQPYVPMHASACFWSMGLQREDTNDGPNPDGGDLPALSRFHLRRTDRRRHDLQNRGQRRLDT